MCTTVAGNTAFKIIMVIVVVARPGRGDGSGWFIWVQLDLVLLRLLGRFQKLRMPPAEALRLCIGCCILWGVTSIVCFANKHYSSSCGKSHRLRPYTWIVWQISDYSKKACKEI